MVKPNKKTRKKRIGASLVAVVMAVSMLLPSTSVLAETSMDEPTTVNAAMVEDTAPDDATVQEQIPADSITSEAPTDVEISIPRMEAENADKTVQSNSAAGYTVRIHAEAADNMNGVKNIWIGYRFTLKVPDGYDNNAAKFTAVSYSWLQDLTTGTKTAEPTFDVTTNTWTLEGKFLYNEAQGLGSSAVQEYARSIAVNAGWLRSGVTITPTVEAWVVDGNSAGTANADTVTVKTSPVVKNSVSTPNTAVSGYYDAATRKFYYTKDEATAAGATGAVPGRVYQFNAAAYIEQATGNEAFVKDSELTMHVPVSVATNSGAETGAGLQPILLGAHYDWSKDTDKNLYTNGLAGDVTFDGRLAGYLSDISNYPGPGNSRTNEMTSVSYRNNTITATVKGNTAGGAEITYHSAYFVLFVPVDETDTDATKRTLTVGTSTIDSITFPSGNTVSGTDGGAKKDVIVPPLSGTGSLAGAYTREIYFNGQNKASIGSFYSIYANVQNVESDIEAEISAFDMLVKVDADAFVLDTSKPTIFAAAGGINNAYGAASYPVKYAVLDSGRNWASDEEMNNTKKAELAYYESGTVPAGAKVVGILIQGRGGRQGKGRTFFMIPQTITTDASQAGTVHQTVIDIDIWSHGYDVNGDASNFNAGMYASDDGGYKKDIWDADGHVTQLSSHTFGDSLMLTAYRLTGKAYSLNGTNRPVDTIGTSTYDVTAGQRTADVKYEIKIDYSGEAATENKEQELNFNVYIPKQSGKVALQKDSVRLDAAYELESPTSSGLITGGIAPTSIQTNPSNGNEWVYTFTVKGSGVYNVYGKVTLGDALNPDNDVQTGSINYYSSSAPAASSSMMISGSQALTNNFIITKSSAAGFQKLAMEGGVAADGELGYRMILSAQKANLTGAMLLDILPFNGDGRGTSFNGTYTVEKPVTLTLNTTHTEDGLLTSGELYYTTGKAIQKTPLNTITDLNGMTMTDGSTALGVTWYKASMSSSGKTTSYTVDPNTTAIVLSGTIGADESPLVDLYLQTAGTKGGDQFVNTAGTNAKEFGKPMESATAPIFVADRGFTGTAWSDVNHNGAQDAGEPGISGLTVKLFQGDTEITADENGDAYHVTTAADGSYTFEHIPSSPEAYHVEFSGGDIANYVVTTKAASGVDEDKNSDVNANPATGTLVSAVSDEINLLTLEQQITANIPVDTQQIDAGLVQKVHVTFDANGGTPTPDEQHMLSGDLLYKPTEPTKEGFNFQGWYYTDAAGKEAAWDFTNPVTGDLNLVAKWGENLYTVKYDTQGAGMIADKTGIKYTDASLLPADTITKDGYTFLGWKYGDTVVSDTNTYESLAKDDTLTSITLAAEWKENIYKVKYDTGFEDVTVADKENVKWNDSNLLAETPKKEGYGFIGWELNDKQITATDKYSDLTTEQTDGSSITLTAKWTELSDYSVLYNTNGGSMPADTPSAVTGMKYGDAVPTPTPVRAGYTFKGWIYQDSIVKENTAYNTLAKDDMMKQIELTAQWEEKNYTVKYDTKGGNSIDDKTDVKFGDDTLLPAKDPVKTGYAFTGWKYEDTTVADTTRYNELAADDTVKSITLEAQWEINKFTVDFIFTSEKNPDSITVPQGVTVEYGGVAVEPQFISPENWTFDGWYTDKECTQKYDFKTAVKSDMTLYGKWIYTAPEIPKPQEPTKPSEPTKPAALGTSDNGTDAPKTGDTMNLNSIIVLFGAAAGSFLLLACMRKKKRNL